MFTDLLTYFEGNKDGADKRGDQRVFSDALQGLDSSPCLLQRRYH